MGATKKVNLMVGFVPIATRFEVAVEDEKGDRHAVCTGTTEKPHDPARVSTRVGCLHPDCDISHSSAFGYSLRGVERDGKLVVLDTEDIATAMGEARTGRPGKAPIQLAFHPREKVYAATVASSSVQNVYPDKGGEKAYTLLRDALVNHPEVVACMIWAPTSANALWVLEVVGSRIVATKRCWPDQMRPTMEIAPVEVLDMERQMIDQLIEATVEDFDLGIYVDEAKRGVEELIASRTGTALPAGDGPRGVPAPGQVPDLIAGLQASIDAAMGGKPAKKAPAKKAAAKRAPAKKTAAPRKRAAAKKAATPLPKAG